MTNGGRSTSRSRPVLVAAAVAVVCLSGCGNDAGDTTPVTTVPSVVTSTGMALPDLPVEVSLAELTPGKDLVAYLKASDAVVVGTVTVAEIIKSPETGEPLHRSTVSVGQVVRGALTRTSFDIVQEAYSSATGGPVNVRGGPLPQKGDQLVVFVRVTDPATEAVALVNSEGYVIVGQGALRDSYPDGPLSQVVSPLGSIDRLVAAVKRGG